MKPKIFININTLRRPLTGIGYYTLNIVKEFIEKDLDLVAIKNGVLLDKNELQRFIASLDTPISANVINGKIRQIVIESLRKVPGIYKLKKMLVERKAKQSLVKLSREGYVYFEPSFIPLAFDGPIITTIHDLSFITHAEFHPKNRVDFLITEMRRSVLKSSHIIVDSDFILNELHSRYPESSSKSSTVYLGVDAAFCRYEIQETENTLQRFNLKYKEFILSVATLEPRKNLSRLVEAYSELSKSVRQSIPLVLAGGYGWKVKELLINSKELVDSGQIVFTGYLDDKELKHLYSAAKIFAYPSLYEGFGLPIIEAMASGTPVLTSNTGATAEVAGRNAILVDPYSVSDISDKLKEMLSDNEKAKVLASNALAYVCKYNWEDTTNQILRIASSLS